MSHVLRGWRWRLTLAPLGFKPTLSTSVYSVFIAYAANLVVPRVGEVSRCVVLEQYDRIPFAQSLGTLISERLVDTLTVMLITVMAVTLQWNVFCRFIGEVGIVTPGKGVSASVNSWIIIAISAAAIVSLLVFFIRKMTFWKKIRSFVTRYAEGLLSLTKMKNGWMFIAETAGIWFCYFMQFYTCFF
jgi:hypothetical protein